MNIKQKFDLFYSNTVNQKIEVSDQTNFGQCMDLAYMWTFCLDIPKATIQRLYAKYVYTQANDLTRQHFDVIPNTPTGVPGVGDLVVFDSTSANIAGHISISNGVGDINTFQSYDQNWIAGQKPIIVTHGYNSPKVLGWLRPKVVLDDAQCQADLTSARIEISYKNTQISNLEQQVRDQKDRLARFKADTRTYVDSYPI